MLHKSRIKIKNTLSEAKYILEHLWDSALQWPLLCLITVAALMVVAVPLPLYYQWVYGIFFYGIDAAD
ncbi:hypothetical protein [Zymomonas mobilis]|uniref:Uncharacterized protein n=1 Tax=Zymomonas mobilis subsp. mobilis (strain ATCC 31821 / ZM4 / CP4) TaxID=264203 RepID=Q5NNK4_ZYMMO|nr:hypothetical protein [Zymomonas mobilis]AAV89706.2 hypothetical protein ZMO1082 [Zymomonas mobilis subsp. mobilis ZM4 = ATCC 31821]AVZ25977.1 hypothetical protein ZMO2_ZMO1082 [Zymomonas mobilis subsp. mobilis]AVZ27868.1 hypothetical protein ZMO3_ZMO1082 [Zymomonas mobilis subsp. mobilis]UBQ07088.1 hypothetical protein LB319_05560 [Zymomonas mobilis]HCE37959.1 hypothetical protein [Zymomonas mobilis]